MSSIEKEIEEIENISLNSQREERKEDTLVNSGIINNSHLIDLKREENENHPNIENHILENEKNMEMNSSNLLIQEAHALNNMSSTGEEDILAKIDKEANNVSSKVSHEMKFFNKYQNLNDEELKQLLKDKK
jgi:hypothetical protein